ncbi:hypothetical protein GCM10023093_12050 [Nemorincola caseinilytica]|uniref:DUF4402 domain-containing protein n=1 Tax=Nemorincola caseinilytica TaxID=2054315 RepID=A0ABP8NC89_9BACT
MNNKSVRTILVAAVLVCCGQVCKAQHTALASASASVVAPISLAKNVDMNFGNAAVSSTTGGAVILSPDGMRTTGGSGVTLPAASGVVSAAGFTVAGAPGFTYAITLPESAIISGPGTAALLIDAFTSIPSATGTLDATGSQILKVGATLNITAAQAPGTYTNASALPVTVNYN